MNEMTRKNEGLKVSSPAEAFALELEHRSRFRAGPISGGSVHGETEQDWGWLPEEYWEAAKGAVYAVYSYATPVIWETRDGRWVRPKVSYRVATARHVSEMQAALKAIGIVPTLI